LYCIILFVHPKFRIVMLNKFYQIKFETARNIQNSILYICVVLVHEYLINFDIAIIQIMKSVSNGPTVIILSRFHSVLTNLFFTKFNFP
jgi:hypothetical protein